MCRSQRIPVNGLVLKAKAEELSVTLGINGWKCSEGWLYRWKKRHGILYKTVCGKRGSVDDDATDKWVEDVLKPKLAQYSLENVFNLDETALFWRLLPDKTHCFKKDKCQGGKKSKKRVTVLLCSNMDGSEKKPPLLIGKFNKPRCFNGVKKLPVEYKANRKAWLTGDVFKEWLLSFDQEMEGQERKVLLVLDNCSAHQIPAHLNATDILFLPPNSTSKLQPCDAGIIQNMKVHYRTAKVLKLVAYTDAGGSAENYQFSLLDAVCTLKQAWDKVSPTTISRCFRKAGFKMDEEPEMGEFTEAEHVDSETDELFSEWEFTEAEHVDSEIDELFSEWDMPISDYIQVGEWRIRRYGTFEHRPETEEAHTGKPRRH